MVPFGSKIIETLGRDVLKSKMPILKELEKTRFANIFVEIVLSLITYG